MDRREVMKILENITIGYKRIATGIAIVLFLTVMYVALIPGGSVAANGVFNALSGAPIAGAFVKIVEWPQYNATTDSNGNYTMPNVPIGTYHIAASAPGYATNVTPFTVGTGNNLLNFALTPPLTYESVFLLLYGTSYDSAIHVRNPQVVNASVKMDVYYTNGTLAGSSRYEIAPNASIAKFANDIMGFSTDAAFSARVTSDVPVAMTSDVRSITTGILSSVPGQKAPTSNTLYSAFIIWDPANNLDSAVHIRNLQNTNVNTTVELHYSNGTLAASKTYTIPPNGSVADFTNAILGNSNYFKGSVKFISTAPVVSTADVRSISTGVLASIPGQEIPASTTQESVFLINGYGYGSYVQFVNPQSTANNVTVYLYYDNGTLASTQVYTLQQNESRDVNVGGTTYVGSAKVVSEQPVVEQSSIVTLSSAVYASVRGQTPNLNLNGAWTLNGYGYDSAIHIRNPQSTTATVTVYLLNSDGTLQASKAYVIAPNAMAGYFTTDILGGNINFVGSVLFVSDNPVVVTNDIRAVAPGVLTSQPGIVS
jgi:hypothetical protein